MQTMLTPKLKYEIRELIDEHIRERHVTREDFTELKDIVRDIANEQRKLTEAQKRTEGKVEELADAQKGAQKEIKALAQAMNYTRRDLGGVTSTLGFMLENEAYRMLPNLLNNRYGIEIKERFLRRSIKSLGLKEDGEVNIFSRGIYKDRGTEVIIIGESKSQLGKDDIDDLLELSAKLEKIDKGERFLLMITHYAKETVIEYAKEKGVEVIQSFEW